MRRVSTGLTQVAATRSIAGVAPVLHFPVAEPKLPRDQQIAKNTNIAIDLTKRFKGPIPQPYKRRHTATIEQIEKEIDHLLGGADKLRKPITDDMSMDKLSLMERCLRHGLWSYQKEEGKYDFEAMQKWLVYTPTDETKMALLKRSVDLKEKYVAFREKRKAAGLADAPLPTVNWAQEYSAVADREAVAEKRFRYDTLAVNTADKDEAKLAALSAEYRKPSQDERLDKLCDLLERFKPILAREAILQRLTIKHLEGQLGTWRYLDWNPAIRDRAELEMDAWAVPFWQRGEEYRLSAVRMRSKTEVAAVMEKNQAALSAARQAAAPTKSSSAGGDAERERLLKEVLALQARIGKKSDDEKVEAEKKA